jgi:DNA-binding XRE family transcriptional regulator
MSQASLGRALGVSRCTINRIERGRQIPHPTLAMMIEIWIERQANQEDLKCPVN